MDDGWPYISYGVTLPQRQTTLRKFDQKFSETVQNAQTLFYDHQLCHYRPYHMDVDTLD